MILAEANRYITRSKYYKFNFVYKLNNNDNSCFNYDVNFTS